MKHFVEIRDIKDEEVYYVRKFGHYNETAPLAFSELCLFVKNHNMALPDVNSNIKLIGIAHDNPCIKEDKKCRFDFCITVTKVVPLEGDVNLQTIRGGKYAVFIHKGPYQNLAPLFHAICEDWLPNSNYKKRDLPMFQVYLNDWQKVKPEDLLAEIYLPIE